MKRQTQIRPSQGGKMHKPVGKYPHHPGAVVSADDACDACGFHVCSCVCRKESGGCGMAMPRCECDAVDAELEPECGDDDLWVCSNCGSAEVEEKAWLDMNTHEVVDPDIDGGH